MRHAPHFFLLCVCALVCACVSLSVRYTRRPAKGLPRAAGARSSRARGMKGILASVSRLPPRYENVEQKESGAPFARDKVSKRPFFKAGLEYVLLHMAKAAITCTCSRQTTPQPIGFRVRALSAYRRYARSNYPLHRQTSSPVDISSPHLTDQESFSPRKKRSPQHLCSLRRPFYR